MKGAQAFMDSWLLPAGEPVKGKTYRADGWTYRDLPNLSIENFYKFVQIIGDDNLL